MTTELTRNDVIAKTLLELGVEDDTLACDFIRSILDDASESETNKAEQLQDCISGIIDESKHYLVEEHVKSILETYKPIRQETSKCASSFEDSLGQTEERIVTSKRMDDDIKKKLVASYGYSIAATVDFEDGAIAESAAIGIGITTNGPHESDDKQNMNRRLVSEKQKAERDAARRSHQEELKRIAAAKALEKEKKEKEKIRVSKKERRSGR